MHKNILLGDLSLYEGISIVKIHTLLYLYNSSLVQCTLCESNSGDTDTITFRFSIYMRV